MESPGGSERAEAFHAWADENANGAEALYKLFGDGGPPSITSIWYPETPEPGWGVGLTYGMSLLHGSNAELLIVVQSSDPAWVWALADFVARKRSEMNDIGVGDTIRWGEPISSESPMDAFYIAAATGALGSGDVVHLDDHDHIRMLQAIPVHSTELALVREIGGAAFAARIGEGLLDPNRNAVR